MTYRVVLYQTARGNRPVRQYITNLDNSTFAKYLRLINLLTQSGPNLGMPYSKRLTSHLNELRVLGKNSIRVIYTQIDNIYVLLHAFQKKTRKTPTREIQTAESRRLTLI